MHNKTISWNDNWILIFICFMGRLLLEPSASSPSSFMVASFLIQMLRWIRGSSRVEIFIFLIAWGIFFERLIFICFHLLFSSYESSFFFFLESAESNHFLLAHIPQMNESHDTGRPFKVLITISYSSSISSSWHRTLPFGVFKDDTWGMIWSLIEFSMILLALSLASSPFVS